MDFCYRSAMTVCVVTLAFSLGCVSTPHAIPIGEWSGQGTYVDYEAIGKEKLTDVTASRSKDGVYETFLKVSKQRLYGHDALAFEIRSKRGKLLNVKDEESHILFKLVPLETLENGSKLYAVVGSEYNPTSESIIEEEKFSEQLRVASASSFQEGATTVLQVCYNIPTKHDSMSFFDTFFFEGARVRKVGLATKVDITEKDKKPVAYKLMKVYWVETLRKRT